MAIPDSIKITKKILANFFNINEKQTLVDNKNGSFSLQSNSASLLTSDNKGIYTLWGFPVKGNLKDTWVKYPIYFAFNIKLLRNEAIAEVNIKLFKEDTTKISDSITIPTELLLRVEWCNDAQYDLSGRIHAQPHWHIHSYTVVDKLEGINMNDRNLFLEILNKDDSFSIMNNIDNEINSESNIEKTERVKKEIPSFKFHLAMLADWDQQTTTKNDKLLTSDVLERWLPKCLTYTQQQIEYLLEKMSNN